MLFEIGDWLDNTDASACFWGQWKRNLVPLVYFQHCFNVAMMPHNAEKHQDSTIDL